MADVRHPSVIVLADLRWPDGTGIGVVKKELLRRIPSSFEVIDLSVKGSIGSPLSPVQIALALARKRTIRGVFWSPGFMPPAFSEVPTVVTVHDLAHLHFYSRLHAAYYNLVLKRLYRRATEIVCVSNSTRHEFLNWSQISAARVTTIHNGISEEFGRISGRQKLPFSYAFYPGNHRENKNTERLMAAYSASALPGRDIHLVFTGSSTNKLRKIASVHGVLGRVHFMGNLPDCEIVSLYKGALLVAYVSLYEGFGLPILEALATGVPVLTSNASAMPEISGDAATLVDPYSIDSISLGLNKIAFDLPERERKIRLGLARVKCFSWDDAAAKLWDLVSSAHGDKSATT